MCFCFLIIPSATGVMLSQRNLTVRPLGSTMRAHREASGHARPALTALTARDASGARLARYT